MGGSYHRTDILGYFKIGRMSFMVDEKEFKQKMKGIFSKLTPYKRRMEYLIFSSMIFIILGYGFDAIKKSWKGFNGILSYIALERISINFAHISIIFIVISAITISIKNPKSIFKIMTPTLLISLLLIFFGNIGFSYIDKLNNDIVIGILIFVNTVVIWGLVTILYFYFSKYSKSEKFSFIIFKYGFEIAFISILLFFISIYRNFSIVSLFVDYYLILRNAIEMLQNFISIVFLVFAIIIFLINLQLMIVTINTYVKNKKSVLVAPNQEHTQRNIISNLIKKSEYFDYLFIFHISKNVLRSKLFDFEIFSICDIDEITHTKVSDRFNSMEIQYQKLFKGLTNRLLHFKNFISNWFVPVLLSYSIIAIVVYPNIIHNILFQIVLGLSISTQILKGLFVFWIESLCGKVKISKLFFVPINVLISGILYWWKHDKILEILEPKKQNN